MPGEIDALIPHRTPFQFVDEVVAADAQRIVGVRTFGADEPFFGGHFPGYPVVPGVILVESMAQCGGAGVRKAELNTEGLFFLATVTNVKFRRQVRPGETVTMEIDNLRITPRMIKQRGVAKVGDEIAAEAEWMCLVADEPG